MHGITEVTTNPLDPLRLGLIARERALDASHAVLDVLQGAPPEDIVMGTAILFYALCLQCRLDPGQLYAKATAVCLDEDFHKRGNSSAQSLRDFVSIRIMGRETTVS